jgi:leader peptidase (prepilin peptidase) / N-methyltransferase
MLWVAVLGGVAYERARIYGLQPHLNFFQAIAIVFAVTVACVWLTSRGVMTVETTIVLATAAVTAITDLEFGYVFDRVMVAAALGLLVVAIAHANVADALLGGATAAAGLATPWALSRGRGMGLGDVKLAGVLGCGLGLHAALRTLWLAFVLGALAAVALTVAKRRPTETAWPFAPFLALGAVLSAANV